MKSGHPSLLAPWASVHLPTVLRLEDLHAVFILEDDIFWDAIGQQLPPKRCHCIEKQMDELFILQSRLGIHIPEHRRPPLIDAESIFVFRKLSQIAFLDLQQMKSMDRMHTCSGLTFVGRSRHAHSLGSQLLDRISSTAQLKKIQVRSNETNRVVLSYQFTMFAGSNVPFSAFARRPASTHANALSRETVVIDQPIDQMITVELDDSLKALSGIVGLYFRNRFQISPTIAIENTPSASKYL